MVTVLVTGSQGFIGSYVCNELLSHNYEVIGVDNYSKYGMVKRPHDDHPNFTLMEMDVKDLASFSERFYGVDYIIAGAAMIGGISYFHKYAYDLLSTNERIIASTFDLAIKLWSHHNLKKIVVLSSSMVFENTDIYPTPESSIETTPPPFSTYGFQKLATEYFAKGAFEQYGVPYTIVRPFNCVGVGEDEALGADQVEQGNIKMLMSHVLPDLIYKALHLRSTDPLPILGDGEQTRHYTDGKDIARGIRFALESEKALNNDFNLSSPRRTTVMELAKMVWNKIHGRELHRQQIKFEKPFTYDVQIRSPDVSKAKELLSFETTVELEDSVDEVIAWMRKQHGF